MKLVSKTLLASAAAALMLGSIASFSMMGCSDDGGSSSSSGGSTDGVGAVPPARPDGPATTDTASRTFAIDSLKMGTNNGWKKLGYNIDGKISSKNAKDTCKGTADSALDPPHEDGDNGIDNAFGNMILPKLDSVQPDIEGLANTSLRQGSFTIMVQIAGLPADAPSALTGLSGQLFAGGRYFTKEEGAPSDPDAGPPVTPPAYGNTSTDWPVLGAILNNPNDPAQGSKITFSNSYVADGTFVSGDRVTVNLNLTFSGITLELAVRNAIITMKPGPNGTMTDGIISGLLNTEEIATALGKLKGKLGAQFCGSAVDSFIDNLRNASDSLSDGSTDPNKSCDAISIGLGFTAKEIGNPTRVSPPTPEDNTNACE